nr:hypothetical protein [Kibdelosporangium sp. MJ126-NF4]CTQ99082.1 hypothetical protein [Kibdelosporangium sp. MJ126-NF4]
MTWDAARLDAMQLCRILSKAGCTRIARGLLRAQVVHVQRYRDRARQEQHALDREVVFSSLNQTPNIPGSMSTRDSGRGARKPQVPLTRM